MTVITYPTNDRQISQDYILQLHDFCNSNDIDIDFSGIKSKIGVILKKLKIKLNFFFNNRGVTLLKGVDINDLIFRFFN